MEEQELQEVLKDIKDILSTIATWMEATNKRLDAIENWIEIEKASKDMPY